MARLLLGGARDSRRSTQQAKPDLAPLFRGVGRVVMLLHREPRGLAHALGA